MLYSRAAFGVCFVNNFIYVAGGNTSSSEFSATIRCERLNLKTKEWQPIASLNQPCTNCSLCTFKDNQIYRVGGKSDLFN